MSLTFAIADTRVSLPAHSTLALMQGAEPLPSLASIDEVHDALWYARLNRNKYRSMVLEVQLPYVIEDGILQKNITILCNEMVLDEEESGSTHPPMYIDVHFQSYSHLHWYKIQHHPSVMAGNALAINKGLDWRRIECGKVELWMFRSLIRNILLLLATVGIPYNGLSDKWVGCGIRNACGLHLARDAEEQECAQEQQEEAKGYDDDSEDDENGDDDSKYSL
ncbi:hypothetical protein EDB19DRAFT_1827037 [Suillus lakei]|nr:hypothetical protein EDB19DRAFT_1827037 [Suillus lakei]